MMEHASVWGQMLFSNAPALPVGWVMRLGLTVGWAMVLATLGASLAARWPIGARRTLVAALVLWTLVPGPVSPDYWLGLAFHAPSLSAMLICFGLLHHHLFPAVATAARPSSGTVNEVPTFPWVHGSLLFWAVLMGVLLLLDSFAMLPIQIYAWGFSPLVLLGLLVLSLLPGVLCGFSFARNTPEVWFAPSVLLVFAATRLPTGNVWDALLDPWLWLFLLTALLRMHYRRWRIKVLAST